jgi:hypothetical protein
VHGGRQVGLSGPAVALLGPQLVVLGGLGEHLLHAHHRGRPCHRHSAAGLARQAVMPLQVFATFFGDRGIAVAIP